MLETPLSIHTQKLSKVGPGQILMEDNLIAPSAAGDSDTEAALIWVDSVYSPTGVFQA